MMNVQTIRLDIDRLARDMGGTRTSYGQGCRRYVFTTPEARRGCLQLEVHVRGSRTTEIGMERIRGWRVGEYADPWLQENVWPYARRYFQQSRGGGFLPTHGYYSGTTVLTSEALEVLRVWLPQELAWQVDEQRQYMAASA